MKSILCLFISILCIQGFNQIDQAKEIMSKLCSPDFHGRGYVNNGVNIAAQYIANEFHKSGGLPIDSSYFQNLSLDVNTFPKELEIKNGKKNLIPGVDYIVHSSSGSYTGSTKLIAINVFELIAEKEGEILKYKNIAKNEAFLIDQTFTSNRDSVGLINEVGLMLSNVAPVILKTNEKFIWSVGRTATKFPFIKIQSSKLNEKKDLEININNKFIEGFKTKNVLTKIKGKSSDSSFVFTAHYDHLGRMGEATYFPGANDNASGTTMLISLVDHYAKNQPEFDIYFIAFTAEEAGLVGSKYFVEHPLIDLSKIKFLLNLDIMGSGDLGITLVNGSVHKKEFNHMVKINKDLDLLKVVKPRGPTQNSDHYFFDKQGVKTFFIYTMGTNKAYHDIFDKAESLEMNKFEDLRKLFIEFVRTYP